MGNVLMQPDLINADEDGLILPDNQSGAPEEDYGEGVIDLQDYAGSEEDNEATWMDYTRDLVIQPIRAVAQAYTWPASILKMGMVGEALSDIDDIEAAMQRMGKPFDRDQYIKTVMEQSEYVPDQQFLENKITEKTGLDLEPKTGVGKAINKLVFLAKVAKGNIPTRLASGATGVASKELLKAAGVNEHVADIGSDIISGVPQGLSKTAKTLTPEMSRLQQIADKNKIPFYEFMTQKEGGLITPKISAARDAAIKKELGMSSEQAAKAVIEGRLPIATTRNSGVDLQQLEQQAYKDFNAKAAAHKNPISTDQIVSDIEAEVAKIKKSAPSLSQDQQHYVNILEKEAEQLTEKSKNAAQILGPNGKPVAANKRTAKQITAQELAQQHMNYNANQKGLYRKPEFSGKEEATRDAYQFLNSSIRNTMEKQGSKELSESFKNANSLFNQRQVLKRSEALIDSAFANGEYNPKKLNKLLNSEKKGKILRRDLGDKAVNELKEIAEYGEEAVKKTSQILNKPNFFKEVASWGSLAPLMLAPSNVMKGALFLAKPAAERIKGYLLTQPATRSQYNLIIKNAAKGSFNNMKADFQKLEEIINEDYGSLDNFYNQILDDIEVYEGEP